MNTQQAVLNYLLNAYPNPISGQLIADELHFSRNTIWKAIEELRQQGYQIDQQHKKGYLLTSIPSKLDLFQLTHHLKKSWPELSIEVHQTVTSTNDLAKIHATNQEFPALILASEQTNGRGRHGRDFISKIDEGLYFSLVLKPNSTLFQEIPLYTLLTASAITQALESFMDEPLAIKWVNDLFYKGKKVGGILCESIMDIESQQVNAIVIGIGLNLAGSFANTTDDIRQIAGTLFGTNLPNHFNYNELIVQFCHNFLNYHHQLSQKTFLSFYEQRMLGLNQKVTYIQNGQQSQGIIKGIDENGHLLVQIDDHHIESLLGADVHFSSAQFTNFN